MSVLSKTMSSWLGASWQTSLWGLIDAVVTAIFTFTIQNAFPGMSDENKFAMWVAALVLCIVKAIKGFKQKDANVTNSGNPVAASSVPKALN